jgi:hypothetical protein
MTRVFEVGQLAGVPAADQCAVLLTARSDLDLSTAEPARAEVRAACAGRVDAVLLDLTHAFVGVIAIHCIRDVTERVRGPVAVIGAPRWLVDTTPLLGLPAVAHLRTVGAAIDTLRPDGRLDTAPHGGA